jgi:hypothetical protein
MPNPAAKKVQEVADFDYSNSNSMFVLYDGNKIFINMIDLTTELSLQIKTTLESGGMDYEFRYLAHRLYLVINIQGSEEAVFYSLVTDLELLLLKSATLSQQGKFLDKLDAIVQFLPENIEIRSLPPSTSSGSMQYSVKFTV